MLKDLREARQSKIAQGLDMINPYHLEVSLHTSSLSRRSAAMGCD